MFVPVFFRLTKLAIFTTQLSVLFRLRLAHVVIIFSVHCRLAPLPFAISIFYRRRPHSRVRTFRRIAQSTTLVSVFLIGFYRRSGIDFDVPNGGGILYIIVVRAECVSAEWGEGGARETEMLGILY